MAHQEIDLENPEFQNLWKLINYTDNSVFLTGKAGTGKSTFLRYITSHTKKKFVVLAPTGIAAVNVGGMTLHSFFNLPFKPLLPDDPEFAVRTLRKRMKYSREKQKLLKSLELVIIDEISMVRADIIDFIDKILRVFGGNMRLPFGGKQLLLVGDMFQLEPVVTADMRDILKKYYPNSLFFSAKVFNDINIVSIELKKVYRQSDSEFIAMLDRIRLGSASQGDIDLLNRRLITEEHDENESEKMVMTLASRRDIVDYINEKRLKALDSPMITYEGTITGDFPENSLPTSVELELKEGAQVVFIKNDKSNRWVNGTIGRVVCADADNLEVELESGERHSIELEVWSNVKYSLDEKNNKIIETVIGQFIQYPLKLAWALTIHKSQGLTFNNVVIDIGQGAFTSGQTYVALSRCRSLEGLALRSTLAMRDIFVNPAITRFSRSFNDEMLMQSALDRARADDFYNKASHAFDDGDISLAFEYFVEAMKLRNEIANLSAMKLVRRKLRVIDRYKREVESLKASIDADCKKFERLAAEYVSMGYDCLEDEFNPMPALANFDKALSLVPDNIKALKGRIEALKLLGDEAEATKTRKKLNKLKNGKRKKQ